ncbi:MAG: hypothetical protein A4E33_02155 [Methanoregula sp. PtaB.Bin085]|nr:MAG: hypothetical protein A4E33_02155 [Methanoregula sp. PtaB.Bin085]
MTLHKSKNADAFFFSSGSDDPSDTKSRKYIIPVAANISSEHSVESPAGSYSIGHQIPMR